MAFIGNVSLAETQVSSKISSQQRAKNLIGTRFKPPGQDFVQLQSIQALAYHSLDPYPFFHFQDWKKEERGPLPRCMPFTRSMVRRGARWLFGKELKLSLPLNKLIEKQLLSAWEANRMPALLVNAAECAGIQGTRVVKWSWDDSRDDCPLQFQFLSPVDSCRIYYDPHDQTKILMLRVQYPYFESSDGEWYWYREEWTDEEQVHYKPVKAVTAPVRSGNLEYGSVFVVADGNKDPDEYARWEIISRGENPFGIVPCGVLANLETNSPWGAGDLWPVVRIIDRVNLAYHLMDKSNQFDSEPMPVYIDLIADADSLDQPLAPGQARSLKTDNMAEGADMRQGKVTLLESAGKLRPYMSEYALDLRHMVYDAVGYVELLQADISNKGNMTAGVMSLIFAPLIETTDEKRKTYGRYGMVPFLGRLFKGLKTAGIKPFAQEIKPDDDDSFTTKLAWPDYFDLAEMDKNTRIERLILEEQAGYTTHEKAVRIAMVTEEAEDVEAIVEEMKDWVPPVDPEDPKSADALGRKPQARNLQVKKDGTQS